MPDVNDDSRSENAIPPLPETRFGAIQVSEGMLTPRNTAGDTCPQCGSPWPVAPTDPRPQLINGKYAVLGVIGHGGFGVVYKVKNLGLNRIEALKVVLRHRFASEEVEARFRNEVIAGARLQHPGIIVIYDTGVSDEGPFFTMEYEEKGTLKDLIDLRFPKAVTPQTVSTAYFPPEPHPATVESPGSAFAAIHSVAAGDAPLGHRTDPDLPSIRPTPAAPMTTQSGWDDVARRMALIAEAVEYMHRENVCHRDLKPTNILIGDEGRPKLTDFGLAALVAGRADDQSGGSPNYLPPEQAAEWLDSLHRRVPATPAEEPASRSDFFQRGDIYSLGAVFYEMLTGRPPIPSQHFPEDTLKAVRAGNIIPPRQVNPAAPAKLEAICLKCLRLEPSQRYASAAEMAHELREAVQLRSRKLFILGSVILLLCLVLAWAIIQPRLERNASVKKSLALAAEKQGEASELEKQRGDTQMDEQRKNLLIEGGDALLDAIKVSESHNPEHHLDLAKITVAIGRVDEDLRNAPEAIRRYRLARESLKLRKFIDPPRTWFILADAHHWEAVALQDEKKFAEAKEQYRESRELWQKLYDADRNDRDYLRYLARSHGYLGDLEAEEGKMVEADASYKEAHRHRRDLIRRKNPAKEDLYQYARGLGNDGNFHDWEGRFAESKTAYEIQAIELAKCPTPTPRLFQWDRPNGLVAIAEIQLMSRPEVPPEKILAGLEPAKADWDSDIGLKPRILIALGRCLGRMGRDEDAVANLKEAITLYQGLINDGKAQAQDYFRLAQAHAALGETSEYHRAAAVIRLQDAVGRKFRHWRRVEGDPVFGKALRDRPEFQEALVAMKKLRR